MGAWEITKIWQDKDRGFSLNEKSLSNHYDVSEYILDDEEKCDLWKINLQDKEEHKKPEKVELTNEQRKILQTYTPKSKEMSIRDVATKKNIILLIPCPWTVMGCDHFVDFKSPKALVNHIMSKHNTKAGLGKQKVSAIVKEMAKQCLDNYNSMQKLTPMATLSNKELAPFLAKFKGGLETDQTIPKLPEISTQSHVFTQICNAPVSHEFALAVLNLPTIDEEEDDLLNEMDEETENSKNLANSLVQSFTNQIAIKFGEESNSPDQETQIPTEQKKERNKIACVTQGCKVSASKKCEFCYKCCNNSDCKQHKKQRDKKQMVATSVPQEKHTTKTTLIEKNINIDEYAWLVHDFETSGDPSCPKGICDYCVQILQQDSIQTLFNRIIVPRSEISEFNENLTGLDINQCLIEGLNEWEMLLELNKVLPQNIIMLAHNCSFEMNVFSNLFQYWENPKNCVQTPLYQRKKDHLKVLREELGTLQNQTEFVEAEKEISDINQSLRHKTPIALPKLLQDRNVIHVDTIQFLKEKHPTLSSYKQQSLGEHFIKKDYVEQHRALQDCIDLFQIIQKIFPKDLLSQLHEFTLNSKKGVHVDQNSKLFKTINE